MQSRGKISKISRILLAPMVLVSLFLTVVPVQAETASLASVDRLAQYAQTSRIMNAISRAKQLINAEIEKRKLTQPKPLRLTSKNGPVPIVLALWDRETDGITLVPATKKGTEFIPDPASPLASEIASNSGREDNYALKEDSKYLVVGMIHPVLTKVTVKRKVYYDVRDSFYVPYSKGLYVPEVLSAGSDYLSYLIQDAFDELAARQVESRTVPGKLITEVIDPYLIKAIAVIEHADSQVFAADNSEQSLGRFYVKLATNGEECFDSAVSTAGAAGLVQFIPSTYSQLVKSRPELGLIADFRAGMANHKNAIKAEVALLDDYLRLMPDEIIDLYATNKEQAAAFLASSYNGGPSRVKWAYNYWNNAWEEDHWAEYNALDKKTDQLNAAVQKLKKQLATAQKNKQTKEAARIQTLLTKARKDFYADYNRFMAVYKNSLRAETVGYVKKLRTVYVLLASGCFATPNVPTGALPQTAAPVVSVAPVPEPIISASGIPLN
ncbi:MAG: transglycosylase SLT domain-containing protein [bacterium]